MASTSARNSAPAWRRNCGGATSRLIALLS
jgi:hypothetical protein